MRAGAPLGTSIHHHRGQGYCPTQRPLAGLPPPLALQMSPPSPLTRCPQPIARPLWLVKNSWGRTPGTSERGLRGQAAMIRRPQPGTALIVATLRVQRRRSEDWHVWIRFLESKHFFHFPRAWRGSALTAKENIPLKETGSLGVKGCGGPSALRNRTPHSSSRCGMSCQASLRSGSMKAALWDPHCFPPRRWGGGPGLPSAPGGSLVGAFGRTPAFFHPHRAVLAICSFE